LIAQRPDAGELVSSAAEDSNTIDDRTAPTTQKRCRTLSDSDRIGIRMGLELQRVKSETVNDHTKVKSPHRQYRFHTVNLDRAFGD